MFKIIKEHALTILSVAFVIAGVLLYTYPNVMNALNGKYTKKEIENFSKYVQSMEQHGNDVIEDNGDEMAVVEVGLTQLDELFKKIQQYNQLIYEKGQSGLVDAFSYEESGIDLSDYGIEDNMFGYIEIPSIDVKLGIYLGATSDNMSKGAVQLCQTSLPVGGTNTNAVIAAHRGTRKNGDMFRNINKIKIGDKVYITNAWATLTYEAKTIAIIKPDEINRILIQEGKDMVTLISCNPYGKNIQRYVVYCERITDD
jgi:LPXTG-site transpeptidase (sortase) family protein